ncbi:MAG: kelch repeat-containing protein [Candidatus Sericytochromatia bacterium]|nr:kelch repeat-containing protein [Candidatus Sericytochromatia bacterium]
MLPRTLASLLVVSLAAASCAPLNLPGASGARGAVQAERATLRLRWAEVATGSRRLLAATEQPARVRVLIQTRSGATLADQTRDAAGEVQIGDLPLAPGVLVTAVSLRADGTPVPGGTLRTVGALRQGVNQLPLSVEADVAGAIVAALLALDGTASTQVTSEADLEALIGRVVSWQRDLGASDASLLAPAVIAAAWHTAGAPPASHPSFFPAPGRLVLRPGNWPQGLPALAAISAPGVPPVVVRGDTTLVEPVPAGTWTMRVAAPTETGLDASTYSVAVQPGQTVFQTIDFGGQAPLAGLAQARGGAAYGVVPTGPASSALLVVGGVLEEDPTTALISPEATGSIAWVPAADAPATQVVPLQSGVVLPASAVHGGKLYVLGGLGTTGVVGTCSRLSPETGALEAIAPLPEGLKLATSAAAAVGDAIHLVGGFDEAGLLSTAVLSYAPGTDTWASGTLPPLPEPRAGASAVALGGALYVLGGLDANGTTAQGLVIRPADASPAWGLIPPSPTARFGAGAVALAGKVYLIGGAFGDNFNSVLSNAVEVYDPGAGTWSLRPPLSQRRSFPAVGVVDGAVVVAGGLLSSIAFLEAGMPVATVERLQP